MNAGDLVSFDLPSPEGMIPDRGVILSVNRELSHAEEEIQIMMHNGLVIYISDPDFEFYRVEIVNACG